MRSLRLFILMFTMSTLSSIQTVLMAAEIVVSKNSFFTVQLPFDNLEEGGIKNTATLDAAISQAMEVLLIRITGQKSFLSSAAGKGYLKNPKEWLNTYDIKPRLEEGVEIGKNIFLTFSEVKLRTEFSQRLVSIWPLAGRPTTLVMGSLSQEGEWLKIDQEVLQFRVDIDYRGYADQLRLPILLPKVAKDKDWVFPTVSNSVSHIQKALASEQSQNLLSFKLSLKNDEQYQLVWSLFSDSGYILSQGLTQGLNRQILMKSMFEQTLDYYAKVDERKVKKTNKIMLNAFQLEGADQVQGLEDMLKAHQPMIHSVKLVALQSGLVQYQIIYYGSFSEVLAWIQSWKGILFINDFESLQKIDIKLNAVVLSSFDTLKPH